MANSQTAVFKFESDNPIRSIIIAGEPWFVAQDVCTALRIQNVTQALEKLDDDERAMFNIGHEHRSIFDSRVKDINIISESGLYTLILRCRDAVTPGTIPYRFRKWVTSEVLPQIRRTGRYVREELSPADKAQKVVASFMPAILEAMKTESHHTYDYPLKPGYRDFIHSPEGVVGLAEYSMLMNMLRQMEEDGHDVSGAAAEFTTMVNYIVGASKCLRDIQTHAQFINKSAGEF
ncbi:BRO-N domain-containing protein [Atlantibacter hermannii]|uniref:BRO-N domain-containing protein n=1 Tax=Atlantibacter hermannii TaxID=565 RepID=UPI00296E7C52|nr:BRO family protein [Atlantibacter hermannii]MDW4578494.1 BRO family protein [Atlantibacter hermannii]